MGEFLMPSLGADMEYGTVLEWFVGPGDTVHRGDIVAVVKTDKADIEVEIFDDGVIGELLVPVGQEVSVGTPLATVLSENERSPEPPAPAEEPIAAPAPTVAAPEPPVAAPEPASPPSGPRVSPRARKLAAERGVDLDALTAAGATITGADVERAPSAPVAADTGAGMRRAIAAAMSKANREIPHYHLAEHVSVRVMSEWLEERNATRPVSERVLPAAVFARAVVLAVQRVPELNGFWIDDGLRAADAVHLGFAVSLRGGGLIAPAVLDADTLDLDELMAAIRDLTGRVRAGRLRGRELSDATITLTNLGTQGVEVVHGVIYPPQVALVGFGSVATRPWVVGDQVVPEPVVAITVAADHRASDGVVGARLLREIARLLEHPEEL